MNGQFVGPIGSQMTRYLELRRSLGYVMKNSENVLRQFDRYLAEEFPHSETITRLAVVGYLGTIKNMAASTRSDYLSQLRQFCRHMVQFHPDTYMPEKNLEPWAKGIHAPYIFSRGDVAKLMLLAMQLPPPSSLRPHTFSTIIGLLWATGIRPAEAMNLDIQDVDLSDGILWIRETKFYKSRLAPLSSSTTRALGCYLGLRARYGHDESPTAPFFINERARRCNSNTVGKTFLELARKLGMKTDQGKDPRLYDFHHTFATLSMLEAYRNGQDPKVRLPILATYLGHVNIAHTEVYLHPLPEMLEAAGSVFHDHVHHEGNQTNWRRQ